jgi:hypothetical protein
VIQRIVVLQDLTVYPSATPPPLMRRPLCH